MKNMIASTELNKEDKIYKIIEPHFGIKNFNQKFIRLEDFFPEKYEAKSDISNHSHYIDLYLMARKFLKLQISSSQVKPQLMRRPYSEGFLIT